MSSFDPNSDHEFDPQNGGYRKPRPQPSKSLVPQFKRFSSQLFGSECVGVINENLRGAELRIIQAINERLRRVFPMGVECGLILEPPSLVRNQDRSFYSAISTFFGTQGDERIYFGFPFNLFQGDIAVTGGEKTDKVEIVDSGTMAIAFVVPNDIWEFRPTNFLFADPTAFSALEQNTSTALEILNLSFQFNGKFPEVHSPESTILYSLALLKAHRIGLESVANGFVRIQDRFTSYDFDPMTHTHSVGIRWFETAATGITPRLVDESYSLSILPDNNWVVRTSVVGIQKK